MADNKRDLALCNMAIDRKLRGCDPVCLKVNDVYATGRVRERASVTQSNARKPVGLEITKTKGLSVERKIQNAEMTGCEFRWPSRVHPSQHQSTRQYARIMRDWVFSIGLEPGVYGTPMRHTKVARICKKTGNLRAVQLLPGHAMMDRTASCLRDDLHDALSLSKAIDL